MSSFITNRPVEVGPRNTVARLAEQRIAELRSVRQFTAQNSFETGCYPIQYYQLLPNGHTCTCHADVTQPDGGDPGIIVNGGLLPGSQRITIDLNSPVFGDNDQDEDVDIDKLAFNDNEDVSSPNVLPDLFAKGTDCGICYRHGFVPGYTAMGRTRVVLSSQHIDTTLGYNINRLVAPDNIERVVDTGFVTFNLNVPKYWNSVKYMVYKNTKQLPEEVLYTSLGTLDTQSLRLASGKNLSIYVKALEFSHVVIEFDFGNIIRANFPQFSVTRDYSNFFALQTVTVELPPTIQNPQIADLLYSPDFGKIWEVIDVQPVYDKNVLVMTAVQCRYINRIETLHNIWDLKTLS